MRRKSSDTVFSMNTRNRIKQLIDERCDGKQVVFSDRTGIPKGTVSHYVNGGNVPSDEYAQKIADTFRVSILWIKGFDVPMDGSDKLRTLKSSSEILTALSSHEEMMFANVFDSAHYKLSESEVKGQYHISHLGDPDNIITISSAELCALNDDITKYASFLLSKRFTHTALLAAHANLNPRPSDGDTPEKDLDKI